MKSEKKSGRKYEKIGYAYAFLFFLPISLLVNTNCSQSLLSKHPATTTKKYAAFALVILNAPDFSIVQTLVTSPGMGITEAQQDFRDFSN